MQRKEKLSIKDMLMENNDIKVFYKIHNNDEVSDMGVIGKDVLEELFNGDLKESLKKNLIGDEENIPYPVYKSVKQLGLDKERSYEVVDVFKEVLKGEKEHNYLVGILKKSIISYLHIELYIPCNDLKRILLEDEFMNISSEEFDNIIKELPIRVINNCYTILPDEEEFIKHPKIDMPLKVLTIEELLEYEEYLLNITWDVMNVLESNDKNLIEEIFLIICNFFFYQFTDENFCIIKKYFKKNYNLSKKQINKILDIIKDCEYQIRYGGLNGYTIDEYYTFDYFENATISHKPKDNDLSSYMDLISTDGKELIKEYYELNSTDDILLEVLSSLEENILETFNKEELTSILELEDCEINEEFPYDFLYSGYGFVYKENGVIKLSIPIEVKDAIRRDINYNDYNDFCLELMARYLIINGALDLDKFFELMQNHIKLSKEKFNYLINEMGGELIDGHIITYFPNMDEASVLELMRAKDIYGEYRIIDPNERYYESHFIKDLSLCLNGLEDYTVKRIITEISYNVFYGCYDKKILKSILEDKNCLGYLEGLDKIIREYSSKIGIWVLNGYTLENKK